MSHPEREKKKGNPLAYERGKGKKRRVHFAEGLWEVPMLSARPGNVERKEETGRNWPRGRKESDHGFTGQCFSKAAKEKIALPCKGGKGGGGEEHFRRSGEKQ